MDLVRNIVKTTVVNFLDENMTYDAVTCAHNAKALSAKLRDLIKEQSFSRYKLVAVVTIGEKKSQHMTAVMKFLWDPKLDRFIDFCLENMYIFVAAIVFATYY